MPLEQLSMDEQIASLKQEVHVAARVAALIEDEVIAKVLEGMLHGAQNEWLDTEDKDQRDKLWVRVQGLKEFINTLRQLIETGKMAATQLESLKNDESNS